MKKILSLILCLTVSSTMMIPAFAAQEEPPAPEAFTYEEIKAMYAGEIAVPPADEAAEAPQPEPEADEEEAAEPEAQEMPEQEAEPEVETETEDSPEINIEEILESEEFAEALDELGEDGEAIEDAIEDGDYEIVEIPEEDLPADIESLNLFELYGASVLTVFAQGTQTLTEGLFLIAIAPAGLLLWAFPPIGAAYMIAGIPLGILFTVGGMVMIISSPVAGIVMTAVIKSE